MPSAQRQTYKSTAQNHVANTTLRFSGFVPAFGPNGGRNVIDKIDVVYDFDDITFVTAGNEGEDVWRSIERAVIAQTDGVERINLQGDELRVYCYQVMPSDQVPEYADQAAGANQSLTYSFPMPLERFYARRPKAFSLPAELLKEVRITCAKTDSTGLGVGGGTVTITAATVYLVAHCHEEFSVELKMVDKVDSQAFQSTSGITLKCGGKLHDLAVFARAASGGASLTSSFTDVRIDRMMPEPLLRDPDLLQPYLAARGAAKNLESTDGGSVRNNPFAAGRAAPILWTDQDTSSFDGDIVDEVIVKTTASQSSMLAIVRTVLPESEGIRKALEKRHGIGPDEWRAKTLSKGANRARHAGNPFIEKSAPLRRRGLAR